MTKAKAGKKQGETMAKGNAEANKKRVKFEFKGKPGLDVFVTGTFNNWNSKEAELKDVRSNGTYTNVLLLAPGRYEYKFVVNGRWCIDPKCQDPIVNENGTLNGVLTVD